MGDMYRPHGGYGDSRRRDEDYYRPDPYYDRGNHARAYDQPYPPPREYNFRGAADRDHRPPERYPQEEFSFRAPGPRFPPQEPRAQYPPPPQRSRNDRYDSRPAPQGKQRAIDAARQRHTQNQRGRGGFRSRAAHTRDILRTSGREPTPEQLEGMNTEGTTRYNDVPSSDSETDESNGVVDLTQDSDDDAPRKRTKRDAPAVSEVPKWSNPDPYTVLPPPESLGAPKKDIVQVIRKAKNDAQALNGGRNAVQENADFISFNFDDDFEDGEASEGSDGMEEHPVDLTESTPPQSTTTFSHRTEFHAKIPPANLPVASKPSASALDMDDLPPPPPPDGFVMPTDDELAAQLVSEGKGMKRKRTDGRSKAKGDIVDAWEMDDSDPTPWCKIDHSQTASLGLR